MKLTILVKHEIDVDDTDKTRCTSKCQGFYEPSWSIGRCIFFNALIDHDTGLHRCQACLNSEDEMKQQCIRNDIIRNDIKGSQ